MSSIDPPSKPVQGVVVMQCNPMCPKEEKQKRHCTVCWDPSCVHSAKKRRSETMRRKQRTFGRLPVRTTICNRGNAFLAEGRIHDGGRFMFHRKSLSCTYLDKTIRMSLYIKAEIFSCAKAKAYAKKLKVSINIKQKRKKNQNGFLSF